VAPEGTGRGDTLVSKAVESRPWPSERQEIPLRLITQGTPGTTATLSVREWALPEGWRARIVDTETGRKPILDAEATVEVSLPSDTTRPAPRYELQVAPTGTPLPVELSAFEAAQGEDGVRLTWQTASETNNAGFAVQRTAARERGDAGAWERVAFVEGAGSTQEPQSYQFTDASLPFAADTLAYRLKQIDTDGTAHLSDAITVGRSAVQAVQLHGSFPNPARAQATIRYALPRATDVRLALYDVLGRRVQVLARGERRSGRHKMSINVSRLASGLYLYRLSTDDGVSMTRKLQVIR
jgi:hypothetical protein